MQAGAIAGSGVYSYNQMRGAAYKGLIDAGVPERLAMAEAVVSSLIEMADTGLDVAMLGFSQLASSLAQKGVKTLAKKGAERVAQSALQKAIKGGCKHKR
ncbi:hypothetical protein SDC9_69352 [bioreactor metagenome]|uniref:Uncharacterized protein n=1 Tax=bioreactor metagenome TaxID=1076179 RepID=A0A644Y2W8_9ZZZZ